MELIGNTFTGGMNSDYHPRFIPQGDYRYALNASVDLEDGDVGALSTEKGNTLITSIPTGYVVIGTISTNDNSFIVFSTNETSSEIGLFSTNKYTTLINTSCLNFSSKAPIQGVYRVRNGCERIIYFTDRVNPLRVINLDELNSYKNTDGSWDCNRFSLSRNIQFPDLSFTIQDIGGALEAGSYQFVVRMLDLDGNSSNWSIPSSIIPISLGNQSGTWNGIKGAYEDKYYDVSKGSISNTSKSIKISLSSLDTSYRFYQIAVIKNLEGLGITTTASILPKVAFSGNSSTYTYTGNLSIEEEASIDELIIDKAPIDIVNTLESTNNALWLGGVKTKSYDWSNFQRSASKITARPKITQVPAYELVKGNPKSYDYSGYAPDEVESFGIVYIFKDGTYSPEFHIPGRRTLDPVETSLLTVWVPDMEPWVTEEEFNSSYAKTEVDTDTKPFLRYYQVFNTGDGSTFSYYQTSQVYPDIRDCNNQSVWGVDSENKPLTGTPIRYHKFPELNNYSLFTKDPFGKIYYNKLDVEFNNITYPNEDIIDHFFVQAKKTDQDKIVKDQGVLTPTFLNPSKASYYYDPTTIKGRRWSDAPRVLWNVFVYLSAKTLYEQVAPSGTYLKLHGVFSSPEQESRKYEVDPTEGRKVDVWINIDDRTNAILHPFTSEAKYNYVIHGRSFVDPGSYQQSPLSTNYGYLNTSLSQGLPFLELFKTNGNDDKIVINTPISPDPFNLSIPRILVSVKDTIEPFQDLFSQEYIPLQGNWILSPLEVVSVLDEDLDFEPEKPLLSFTNRSLAEAQYINGLWAGSEYNYSLRTYPNTGCNTHFLDPGQVPLRTDQLFSYVMGKIAERQESGKYKFLNLDQICKEVYNLNKDYSKVSEERVFFPLPIQYDYCTSCNNVHPSRIWKSQFDNLESYIDNYRVFLANEYTTIDGSGDYIMKLFTDKDELYALTKNYAYYINTRPQEIKTDTLNAYIGSASTFVIPPKRLASPKHGYGGTSDPLSVISTEFGSVWVDSNTGKVFHLSQGLEEVSSNFMTSFFEEDGKLLLRNKFKEELNIDYPYPWQTTYSNAIGISCAYDPRIKRLIVTKIDYLPKYPLSLETNTIKNASTIYFDVNNNNFYIYRNNVRVKIELSDETYFENKSWTASYSFKRKRWISFHSYIPRIYFNNSYEYYTADNNNIYSFSSLRNIPYRTYFNQVKPFEVETTINGAPTVNKTFEGWTIGSSAIKGKILIEKTFDKAWLYNQDTSSGLVNLLKHEPWSNSNGVNSYWRRIKSKYNFSMIRDKTPDTSIYEVGTHNLDKTPNTITVSPFNQGRIGGDYINIKLYLTDQDSATKFSVETIEAMTTKSSR